MTYQRPNANLPESLTLQVGPLRKHLDRKAAAIAMLCMNHSRSKIAKTLGVSRRTLYRWMDDPGFCMRLAQFRTAALQVGQAQVELLQPLAAEAVRQLCKSEDESVRLRAASLILSHNLAHAKAQSDAQATVTISDAEARAELERLNRELASPDKDSPGQR